MCYNVVTKEREVNTMELGRYEKVRMNDGKLHGRLEVVWSTRRNRFEAHTGEYDSEGKPIVLYGTEIVTVEPKKKKFVPTAENCTRRIDVCDATEKAYAYYTGLYSTKGKPHKEWIAKSICYKNENGEVFAPHWA